MQFSPSDMKRLLWHSRRGMLELDLILVPFAENMLGKLSEQQLALYRDLLAEEDQDLFVWLTRREPAPTAALGQIISIVLQNHDSNYG